MSLSRLSVARARARARVCVCVCVCPNVFQQELAELDLPHQQSTVARGREHMYHTNWWGPDLQHQTTGGFYISCRAFCARGKCISMCHTKLVVTPTSVGCIRYSSWLGCWGGGTTPTAGCGPDSPHHSSGGAQNTAYVARSCTKCDF